MQLYPAFSIDDGGGTIEPSLLARLEPDQFAGLEDYMSKLSQRELDLAICLDCTASMSGEIGAAQGGIDDMMVFVGDVVASVRVGLVAYRDERDEFETKAWDFNSDIAKVRQQLWSLSADGGGDAPEAVYPAMKLACTQLNWRTSAEKVLVIVGDAPPHVGYGGMCVNDYGFSKTAGNDMVQWKCDSTIKTRTGSSSSRAMACGPWSTSTARCASMTSAPAARTATHRSMALRR